MEFEGWITKGKGAAMKYTHYVVEGERTVMFNVTACEVCGQPVEDVNAVGGSIADIAKYEALGMVKMNARLPEMLLWADEEGGDGRCYCSRPGCWDGRTPTPTADTPVIDREFSEGGITSIIRQDADRFFARADDSGLGRGWGVAQYGPYRATVAEAAADVPALRAAVAAAAGVLREMNVKPKTV
jgi:hypothetical protein